jgi:hypothetical protein
LFDALIDEAAAEHDVVTRMYSLATKGFMLAFVGEAGTAAEVADAALDCNAKLTGAFEGVSFSCRGRVLGGGRCRSGPTSL